MVGSDTGSRDKHGYSKENRDTLNKTDMEIRDRDNKGMK